jgi:AAA family ATP:ADP antiporter
MKDAVTVTVAGAEVLPFIKVWALLPGAIMLTFVFTKLSNRFSQERVFYMIIAGFLAFFALFAFALYPIRQSLHLHGLADQLTAILPQGLKGMVSMLRYWSFTLFYVMSELWGTIVLSVLFWGLANEITKVTEARRFYGVLCIGANFAGILAGRVAHFLPKETTQISEATEEWGFALRILVLMITGCGIATMAIFRWMNQNVLNDPSFEDLHNTKAMQKAKGKLSVRESFSYLSNSKYLLYIAVMVLAYNLVINMVEIIWKDQLRTLYPSTGDYYNYMSNITSLTGVVSAVVAIFMANIINRFGWTKTALITPIIMLLTSIGFFTFFLFQDNLGSIQALIGMSPLAICVFFGAAQNCLSKAMKYSVFDATKEMAFIPLSHECKLKGKAAIDGVGSRMGKSGGSIIHTGFLMVFGTLAASAPYVASILLFMISYWIWGTCALGKQFAELTQEKQEQGKAAEPAVLAT